jgi:hypothetical protein
MNQARPSDQRKYLRYEAERPVSFDFAYDFESVVAVEPVACAGAPAGKYRAMTKNVSLEGLCLSTDRDLKPGDLLNLEVFIPGDRIPVRLLGEVRWACPAGSVTLLKNCFDAGVVLRTVEGKGVRDTIRFDQEYHVYWSDVLESILGRFRIAQQRPRDEAGGFLE